MVRPHLLLYPQREPAPLRPAATVLLLRDGPTGLEVLMTRRSLSASFAPGAFVFPGGGIDTHDASAQAHALALRREGQSDVALTQAIAAIRESYEELGIALLARADGTAVPAQDLKGLKRSEPLLAQCEAKGWKLATDRVYLLAHWITDRDLPRRFDVPFLVAHLPDGQTPVADETEQFEPVWVSPAEALRRHAAGDFFIIFPTIRTLQRLQAYPTVQSVLQACAVHEGPLFTSCPRAGWLAGAEARYMEHEAPYGELALTSPDGQIVHHLDWQSQHAVGLLKNVQRLTAPNPGFMTGPGTNTYIVGDTQTGFIVIDPGPADEPHLQRLLQATGSNVKAIVCTHSHPDHSPGAVGLATLCTRKGLAPLIYGLPSGPTARVDSRFVPDQVLADGQTLVLQSDNGDAQHRHTLLALHTPGHAANHVCLVLVEDGLLFSGDHILNGSTTVIDPPDGHMGDYLDSLDKLARACSEHQIDFILPAHGYVLGEAHTAITRLKAHRLQREAKIMAVIQADPKGSMDEWVAKAYDDVPERVWPVAKRSLLAHLQHIEGTIV
jgi:glyoxylase-like metal-dependent hydrolase (beta-lactamase superfamily II)/8-oxo-dGTP pyrophosphatase MutT (NUDIX family)